MEFKPTLLVLAAGMGSRYGGLKQIDPVGPNGEVIMDYSLYDAVQAGFKKVVFVIRQSFEEEFKEKIAAKFEGVIEVKYARQQLDCCIGEYVIPESRQKPWGTGHAILVAKDVIQDPFAVINADDFYGSDAYRIMHKQLQNMNSDMSNEYAMVGYVLRNTLSDHGTVARGVCKHSTELYLEDVTECTGISKCDGGAVYLDKQDAQKKLSGNEIVSMNLWGFTPDVFEHLQKQFDEFLKQSGHQEKTEFYIPSVVDRLVKEGLKKVRILKTHDSWFGVTYPQDKQIVQDSIRKLVEAGSYPKKLW